VNELKVFISHSSEDHDFVLELAKKMKNDGIDVWVDDWEIKVGDSIIEKINYGLKKSSFLIVVLSKYSIESDWVKKELSSTIMRQLSGDNITILPVWLEINENEVPPLLREIKATIFSRNYINKSEYKKLIDPIKNKIKAKKFLELQDKFFEDVEHIDIILRRKAPTRREVRMILDLIKEEPYNKYFFSKVSSVFWFDILKEEGYFSPSETLYPRSAEDNDYYIIPHWNVLGYLERISQQVNVSVNEKYIDELLTIIKDISDYKDSEGKHIDNYHVWYYFVKILLNLPNEKIPLDIIRLIPIWLDSKFDTSIQGKEIAVSLLQKFLTDNQKDIKKAEEIIKFVTTLKTVPLPENEAKLYGKSEEAEFVIDSYLLLEAFKKHVRNISKKCSIRVIEDLIRKVRNLLTNETDGTFFSFYEEPESLSEPLNILTFIIKRILLAKAKKDSEIVKPLLLKFLRDQFLYFLKMALFVIGQNMNAYEEVFWKIFKTDIGNKILENTLSLGDELKHVLKNLKNLNNEKRETLNKKIEKAAKRYEDNEDAERAIALYKQKIYKALSHDRFFRDLYNEMNRITKIDIELHPAIGKIEMRWESEQSPLTKEEIFKMSNSELVKYLSKFKTADSWEGPTVEGLAKSLTELAQEIPEKFIDDLEPLKNASFYYVYYILGGIKKAWKAKKDLEWGKLLDFIKAYINREEFWQNKIISPVKDLKVTNEWVVGAVSTLIYEGVKDESRTFPEKYFDKAEKIVFLLLDNLKPKKEKGISDYLYYSLNTTIGMVLEAFIYLSLRIDHLNDKNGIRNEAIWSQKFKEKYEELLNKNVIEAYTWFGRYLPQFYYLDKAWTEKKIESLESEKGSENWEAFICGYLSIGRLSGELYNLMRPNCQFSIDYNFKTKQYKDLLVQYISLGYLKKYESLKTESLFRQIIDKFDFDQIKDVIRFFWMQRESLTQASDDNRNMKKRIIEFWHHIYKKYESKSETCLAPEDKEILADISKLTVFLPEINDEFFKWLMQSAPYVNENINYPFFIEYLDVLKDKGIRVKTAEYIGKILLQMLKYSSPGYPETRIKSIVEFLYATSSQQVKNLADQICNQYGEKGYYFLSEIYNRHHKKSEK